MTATPACLKAAVAGAITFTISGGDFSTFPLEASRKRGDTSDNPIGTAYGTTYTVVPGVPGFLGYYVPGASSDTSGTRMAGVIWVSP